METSENKSRYSVSRKGMGGAPVKYDETLLKEILALKEQGTSILQTCKDRNLPYVSINAALRRTGLKVKRVKEVQTVDIPAAGTTTPTT